MQRSDIAKLSDQELREQLVANGIGAPGPIIPSTRGVYEVLLLRQLTESVSDSDIPLSSPSTSKGPELKSSFIASSQSYSSRSQPLPRLSDTFQYESHTQASYADSYSFGKPVHISSPLSRPPLGQSYTQSTASTQGLASTQKKKEGGGSSIGKIAVAALVVVAAIVIYIILMPSAHYPLIN